MLHRAGLDGRAACRGEASQLHLDHVIGVAVVAGDEPAAALLLHGLQQIAQVLVHRRARPHHGLQVARVTHLRQF